jgi:hypothetical protein
MQCIRMRDDPEHADDVSAVFLYEQIGKRGTELWL